MKTALCLTLWGLLASYAIYSQNPIENCPYKFEIASDYLRDFGFASHEMVAEIRESIRHCDENIPNANYALGMLGRFYAESEQDKEAAFNRIESAALQGHATIGVSGLKTLTDKLYLNIDAGVILGSENLTELNGKQYDRFFVGLSSFQGILFVPTTKWAIVLKAGIYEEVLTSKLYGYDVGLLLGVGLKF